MKKVIDSKVYNTETAKLVAERGIWSGSFSDFSEEIYKTKKGNYFMYGYGGPKSPYSKTIGNTTSGSSEITALTENEVINLLKNWNEIDVLEKFFPASIEEA